MDPRDVRPDRRQRPVHRQWRCRRRCRRHARRRHHPAGRCCRRGRHRADLDRRCLHRLPGSDHPGPDHLGLRGRGARARGQARAQAMHQPGLLLRHRQLCSAASRAAAPIAATPARSPASCRSRSDPSSASPSATPKTPNCSGLSFTALQEVDWTKVDLDEWVATPGRQRPTARCREHHRRAAHRQPARDRCRRPGRRCRRAARRRPAHHGPDRPGRRPRCSERGPRRADALPPARRRRPQAPAEYTDLANIPGELLLPWKLPNRWQEQIPLDPGGPPPGGSAGEPWSICAPATPGRTIAVRNNGELAAALTHAQCGDQITATGSFSGSFALQQELQPGHPHRPPLRGECELHQRHDHARRLLRHRDRDELQRQPRGPARRPQPGRRQRLPQRQRACRAYHRRRVEQPGRPQ